MLSIYTQSLKCHEGRMDYLMICQDCGTTLEPFEAEVLKTLCVDCRTERFIES